ncbi:Acetyl-coenzyme A transferase nodX [Psilocybe cubensis]|uniref:Acetyl-coenzyme A transferase nodX n=2 Tax=Psilocybe cubensis TaxID=181762 RepID=A0ACB8GNX6_PSICU|nr:Acetyl-coenzyme A transferase nodX [Psilocybe cubensis]KAH9477353.1 Acetyl-coenzyme A transferase nodX [Psilocybe cubensis]
MDSYSVISESRKLLVDGILKNPLHTSLPSDIEDAAKSVEYTGSGMPSIPVNWRWTESISALKGFQASMLNVLLKKKYGLEYQKVIINTDHAQLFIMSILLTIIDPLEGKLRFNDPGCTKFFPNGDKFQGMLGSPLTEAATNIYKTKDERFYHIHGSMNATPVEMALGIDPNDKVMDYTGACAVYQAKIGQLVATDLDSLMNDHYRQAGTICYSIDEYKATEQGQANAHVGLYEIHHLPIPKQAPGWWTSVDQYTSGKRPLFGLKVVDLTRVIASPTITRELAELGASVMRITSPNITDMTVLLCDLGWGKWNAHLDLTKSEDRARLRSLIEECDVVVDGYRPGIMEKWGFGKDDILGFFKEKERGIIYVHENCYAWNGPWSHRSGWQQISDACCGVSMEYGRAMGNDEPVTPPLPATDYCTGIIGAVGVLQALIQQSEKGGSYVVDIALNYYSQWLINKCSTYPTNVWEALWTNGGRPIFRHTDNMFITFPPILRTLMAQQSPILNPEFFEIRDNKAIGVPVKTVKPILNFPDGIVKPGYNVGARGNGVDQPVWPHDLMQEIVTL